MTPANAFWTCWAAAIASGFVLMWHDAQFGQYGPFQLVPNPKLVLGLALIVASAFIAIGYSIAGAIS